MIPRLAQVPQLTDYWLIRALVLGLLSYSFTMFARGAQIPIDDSVPSPPQPTRQSLSYVESWKKGPRQVKERSFHIQFTKQDAEYERVFEDSTGEIRYAQSVVPIVTLKRQRVGWYVRLREDGTKHSFLQPERGIGHHFAQENSVAVLYPADYPTVQLGDLLHVPLSARRVIKVESFYCIIQVSAYKLASKRIGFTSISVDIDLTNTYAGPRNSR
jgi:hypothetical protein